MEALCAAHAVFIRVFSMWNLQNILHRVWGEHLWNDPCAREGYGYLAEPSFCYHSGSGIMLSETAASRCIVSGGPGFVVGYVELRLERYFEEVSNSLSVLQLEDHRHAFEKVVAEKPKCSLCLRTECLGDDFAVRAFVFRFHMQLPEFPFKLMSALPSFRPDDYTWIEVLQHSEAISWETRHKFIISPAWNRDVQSFDQVAQHDSSRLRVAIANAAWHPRGGGGKWLFGESNHAHMGRLWRHVAPGLWQLKFETMASIAAQDDLMLKCWGCSAFYLHGFIFGWRTDLILIGATDTAACEWVADNYDVLIFTYSREVLQYLPWVPGKGPVRLLMPTEPHLTVLEENQDVYHSRTWHLQQQRFFREHGICPVILDHYGISWIDAHDGYPPRRNQSDRAKKDPTSFSPLFMWPTSHKWQLGIFNSLSGFAEVGSKREQGLVIVGPCFTFPLEEKEKLATHLRGLGLKPMFPDMTKRRHSIRYDVQPRAFARSRREHLAELASSKYVLLLCHSITAGQLIAEAALLGVLVMSLPQKIFTRVLLPPELHVTSVHDTISRVEWFEKNPKRAAALRNLIRERARRMIGEMSLPPLRSLLQVFARLKQPRNEYSLPMSLLCAPRRNVSGGEDSATSEPATGIKFWLFALGHMCGDASIEKAGPLVVRSVVQCAEHCDAIKNCVVFTLDETSRCCRTYAYCQIAAPDFWNTDVYVLDDASSRFPPRGFGMPAISI